MTSPLFRSLFALALVPTLAAQDKPHPDGKEELPSSQDRVAPDHESMRYFLIGAPELGQNVPKREVPKEGYRLLLILPGGPGSADFETFCRRITKHAVDPKRYLVAQLVAPVWSKQQAKTVVWPTEKSKLWEAEFTTEAFIDAVIRDVESMHKLDRKYIFTFCWSSSGPACYQYSLAKKSRATGSFLAMAAFKPKQLGSLRRAKGHPYFLLHSPEEKVVPFRMAQDAERRLTKKGAEVELVEYAGGHGWHGDLYGNMRRGIEWLENKHTKAKRAKQPKRTKAPKDTTGKGPR